MLKLTFAEDEIAKANAYGVKFIERPVKPFLTVTHLERGNFKTDFPEVELERLRKKKQIADEKNRLKMVAEGVAIHTYKLMIRICNDLIHGRRPLRSAFETWLEATDMKQIARRAARRALKKSDDELTIESEAPEVEVQTDLTPAEIEAQKRKNRLKDQLGKTKGMDAVLERVLPGAHNEVAEADGEDEDKFDIYATLVLFFPSRCVDSLLL